MRTFLIFLFVATVTLFIYNPSVEDFELHIDELMFHEQHEEARTGLVGRTLGGQQTTFTVSEVVRSTQRNNYFLYSTYEVTLDRAPGPDGEFPKMTFLGIAGMFFETS